MELLKCWHCQKHARCGRLLSPGVVLFPPSLRLHFFFFSFDKSDRALPNTLALTQTTPVVLMKREHQLSDGCWINLVERCQFGQFHC